MGSTISACRNECTQHCEEFMLNDFRRLNSYENTNCFLAQIYCLSEDKSQWIKMHPKMLSLRLKQKSERNEIAQLEVTALEEQPQMPIMVGDNSIEANQHPTEAKTTIMSIPIPAGTHMKRYKDKFVYWRHNQSEQIFGLSLSSSSDLDRFCSAVHHCLPPTPLSCVNQTKMWNNEERSSIGRSTQLKAILMELVSSERAFVQDMQKLLANFVLPSGLQFMQCVRQLHHTHSLFLAAMESMLAPVLSGNCTTINYEQEMKPLLFHIFGLFIAKCTEFKVYSEFTFAHMHFQQLRKENGAFAELIAASSAPIGGLSSLDSLLIKPVQRLCKYPLFLAQFRELCVQSSEERELCIKALKQMRTLANWLNEMQRIQEDYGSQLLAISIPSNSTLANLNFLQLFAHVRFLNPPSHSSNVPTECPIQCALFAFNSSLVILERKWKEENSMERHNKKQQRTTNNKKTLPLILPFNRIQLLMQQKTGNTETSPIQNEWYARFSLALQEERFDSSIPRQQLIIRLFHFECCHPEVCHHLALALRRRRSENVGDEKSEEKSEMPMMVSWRMDASIDSACSTSSDRGYMSGGSGMEQQTNLN